MSDRQSWEQIEPQLALIYQQREKRDAPVDLGGTGALEYDENLTVRRFQMLTSTMLSSQTKDEQTATAVGRLQERGLTVDSILGIGEEELAELLRGVRFASRKAGFLKKTAQIIKEQYDGEVPDSEEELVKLPGVGSKMALVVLEHGWNKTAGLPVDGHFHRIVNRLGWVTTEKAEATREALEKVIPQKKWSGLSELMIGFSQLICHKKVPLCDQCSVREHCRYYRES